RNQPRTSTEEKDLEDAARNHSLTARQKAVLKLLSRGDTNKVIARRLGMGEGTVKVHVRQIMRKFGVTNRTQGRCCLRERSAQPKGGRRWRFWRPPGREGGHARIWCVAVCQFFLRPRVVPASKLVVSSGGRFRHR